MRHRTIGLTVEAGGTSAGRRGDRGSAGQVVLAWMAGGEVPMIPLVGASSVAQLDESLAAVDLELTPEQCRTLDAAG
ncbi:aldo/keto reductase [Spirillospora sp. NPDC047279]|uniref:aldo/keto reductase n=1 Tax=Spirillospora sp. NPDC047279 TaxID=3155478 RepID=UPI0033FEF205